MHPVTIYELLRKSKNWNLSDVARRMGLSRSYIHCIEYGKREPGVETMVKYAETFHVPLGYIQGFHLGDYQNIQDAQVQVAKDVATGNAPDCQMPVTPKFIRGQINLWLKKNYPQAMDAPCIQTVCTSGSLSLAASLESQDYTGNRLEYGMLALHLFHKGEHIPIRPYIVLKKYAKTEKAYCPTKQAVPAFQAAADTWNDCVRKEENHV